MCVSSSLEECAVCLYDSTNETTQLERLIKALGHLMDKTPKYHPEIDGKGDLAASLIAGSRAALVRGDFTMELRGETTVM